MKITCIVAILLAYVVAGGNYLYPSPAPTPDPSPSPTSAPIPSPTDIPTPLPSNNPSKAPSDHPSLSPTKDPSRNPTFTYNPTTNPSYNPTAYPSADPSRLPTAAIYYKADLNITLTIIIYDGDITAAQVVSTIDKTTSKYLDTLSVNYNYNLTVMQISNQNGVLTVSIVVLSDDEQITLNEAEVIEENDEAIDSIYGDKVDVGDKADGIISSASDEIEVNFKIKYDHLLFGMIAMALILICCGCALVVTCSLLRQKSKETKGALPTKNGSDYMMQLSTDSIHAILQKQLTVDTQTNDPQTNDSQTDQDETCSNPGDPGHHHGDLNLAGQSTVIDNDEDLYSVPPHSSATTDGDFVTGSMSQTAKAAMRIASLTQPN